MNQLRSKAVCPCIDCTKRYRACQDTCPELKEYKAIRAEESKKYEDYKTQTGPVLKVIAGQTTAEYKRNVKKYRRGVCK